MSSAAYWFLINLFFAFLFYADISHLQNAHGFIDCFFFSVQTMSTVGYGNMFPISLYAQFIVTFQTWLALIADSILVAIFISKVARPSRLRHTVQFSEIGTINCQESTFESSSVVDSLAGIGKYSISPDVPVLAIRLINLRKRQLCSPSLRVYVLKTESNTRTRTRVLFELDYELAYQFGRARSINYALPHLPLPWTLLHRIDAQSPLKGLSLSAMLEREVEIIAILDAIDELTSASFQVRWSYLPTEIKWGHAFAEMVTRDHRNRLSIDIRKLNSTTLLASDPFRNPSHML
jgi:inward rectifier potassium channel